MLQIGIWGSMQDMYEMLLVRYVKLRGKESGKRAGAGVYPQKPNIERVALDIGGE